MKQVVSAPVSRHRGAPAVAITPAVEEALHAGAVCAIGVSGGKDSQMAAVTVAQLLNRLGHKGPRLLVHADLGAIEWTASQTVCERLAAHLNMELLVVRRKAGGLLERWETRWANNLERYRTLSCVRMILPWSTPQMRFCTSELKAAVIAQALKARFKHEVLVNVTGVRREESNARRNAPIAKLDPRLTRKQQQGFLWNPLADWTVSDVFAGVRAARLDLHEAYTTYGSSRVSCTFCILASLNDLRSAAACDQNRAAYLRIVKLEVASAFAFQGARWLGDVAPALLSDQLRHGLDAAKAIAAERQKIESSIPQHLLYTAGWPTAMPTHQEAAVIADVRRLVASLYGLDVLCTCAYAVQARYATLMEARRAKEQVAHA